MKAESPRREKAPHSCILSHIFGVYLANVIRRYHFFECSKVIGSAVDSQEFSVQFKKSSNLPIYDLTVQLLIIFARAGFMFYSIWIWLEKKVGKVHALSHKLGSMLSNL